MSIDFPTFEDKQILTPEDLNDFVQDLQDKFTAGIGSADITWPLLAEGNLELDIHQITGGRSIWGVVNAAEYDTLDAALAAASGGVCFIPPNTTIEASSVAIPGAGTAIIGCGQSSVIRASSGATGSLLKNSTSGVTSQLVIANLQLDGNNETCDGLELNGAQYCMISNVQFEDFDGDALKITADGATVSERILVTNCHFRGNDIHVDITAIRDAAISNCYFRSADDTALRAVGSDIRRLTVNGCVFRDSDAESVQIIGGAASYSADASEIVVANNVIDGSGMVDSVPCIEVGSSAGYMQNITIDGNQITSANSDAIKVYARYGSITGNNAYGAGGDGLDLTSSEDLVVTGNNFAGAGAYGVDGSSSTDCVVSNNVLSGATTDAINLGGTRLRQYHNAGAVGAPPPNTFSTTNGTMTLPAGTLQIGDQIDLNVYFDSSAAGGAGSVRIYLNGQEIGRTASNSSTQPRIIHSTIEVTGSTTAEYFAYGCISADGLLVTHSNTVSGLDLTSDMNFTVTNTNLTRSYIKYVAALSSREDG